MNSKNYPFIFYLILYSIVSLLSLTLFPAVHSDEVWLAGLTNDYINMHSIFISESFFDLMPRTVHLIKALYHLLQIPYIQLIGYTIFSVRLLSLTAAIFVLWFYYQWLSSTKYSYVLSLLGAIYLSTFSQFIYASHFARQEILLLLVLILCLRIYQASKKNYIIVIGIILGLSIGLHPNSFIVASMIGTLLLWDLVKKNITRQRFLLFVSIIGIFALFFVGVSLLVNPSFISDYLNYGRTLNVDAPPSIRFDNFIDFYIKLYYQISGTYYIPNIRILLITGSLLSIYHLFLGYFTKTRILKHLVQNIDVRDHLHILLTWCFKLSLMAIAFNITVFIIGRFNTTSILFLVIVFIAQLTLSITVMINLFSSLSHTNISKILILLFIVLILLNIRSVWHDYQLIEGHDYNRYEKSLNHYLDDDSIVLGNVSSGFIFKDTTFYDIRNLAFLDNMTIEKYITERNINIIIYYEEYDYINRNPMWSILYGEDRYYEDLQQFLTEKATLKGSIEDTFYGSRIIRYMGDYPWKIYVFEVNTD